MQAQLEAIVSETESAVPAIRTRPEFDAFKARISGPHGSLTQAMKAVGKLPKEEDLDFLAQSAMDDACRPGNPKEPTKEDIVALYRSLL